MTMQAIMDEGIYWCGGWIEGSGGVLTSPHYPNAFSYPRHCQWRLMPSEGRRMTLRFSDFNLPRDESSGMCLSYIKVSNMSSWRQEANSPEVCGTTLPDTIYSSTGYLNLVFFTHGLAAGQGFSLTYDSNAEGICGGVLNSPSGVISYLPNNSDVSTVDCRWRISLDSPDNMTIVFRFDVLDVPGVVANYCRDGVLYIMGGKTYLGRYCGNYSEEVVFSSPYSTTQLRMFASQIKPMRGIHGTYNVSNCGGNLNGDTDISSPGYPSGYPPNTVCHWIISARAGDTITLTFLDLRLEDNCDKDYVMVRNGLHHSSPIVGKFCGNHVPSPITSSSNVLSVIFHTDAYGSAPGFKVSNREQQRGCGGLIHNNKGNLTSPGHPAHYENNVECRWVIEYAPGYVVRLDFIGRFDLEMGSNCDKDYLLFEELNEDSGNWFQIAKKCGSVTPQPIISSSNKMRITFHSNERITGDGFYFNYTAACGGNFTQSRGEIMSPNYPDFYGDNLNCVYSVGKEGHYVSLTFDDYFSLEGNDDCKYDNITIVSRIASNSTLEHGPYCGTVVPYPRTLQGPVTVKFKTDETYKAHGFKLNYEILDCGSVLTDPSGVISIPKTASGSRTEMDCTWQIVAPSDKVISLRFSQFNFQVGYKCYQNYLEIRDGDVNGTLIGKLCGNSTPIVKSTGNILTLKMYSAGGRAPRDFTAFYYMTYGPSQGCGGTFNHATTGEFRSLDLNSDGLYEPNLDCNFLIIGDSADQVFKVTFLSFDLEPSPNDTCIYDYVEIREDVSVDSALIGRYCGSALPPPIINSGNRLSVLFHSNDRNNRAGFRLKFESVTSPCGRSTLSTVTDDLTRPITSPNYPSPYPVNIRCRWTISNNHSIAEWRNDQVQVTFSDIDVPCDGDYIEVQKIKTTTLPRYYRGPQNGHPIRLCGPTQVHEIIGQHGMAITFHSDSTDNAARGFSFTYKELTCNRNYTRNYGVLTNSGYPGRRNNARKCIMRITTTPGRTISAYFSRFEMYDTQDTCAVNNFKVYDGNNKTATYLIGSYCGFDSPNPIFSTGNSLYFESYMHHFMGVFHLTYTTTDQGRGCGGSIYAEEGSLSSPLFPETYNRNAECVWYISVPGYHSMNVEFKRFVMNSTAGCDSNYVEIYDGFSGNTADRVARYCGSDTPAIHVSRSNEVMVKFKSDSNNHGPGFLLNFESNDFLQDTTLPFIQRYPEVQTSVGNDNTIYLM